MGVGRPLREVRAHHDDATIIVYQAYAPAIADAAVAAGTFVAPFKRQRMTWIKPSFFWMMHRSGWAAKPGQERILAIRLIREGFDRALSMACLSQFEAGVHGTHLEWKQAKETSPVRVQWDPERDADLQTLPWRTIQVGLGPDVVGTYVDDWIVGIHDVTALALRVYRTGERAGVPTEHPYPVPPDTAARLGMG